MMESTHLRSPLRGSRLVPGLLALVLICMAGHPALARPLGPVQESGPQAKRAHRVFTLRYANPSDLRQVLAIFPAVIVANEDLRTLSVRTSEDLMPAIEAVIRRLDVPPPPRRTVVLTAYLLTTAGTATFKPVPRELAPVVKQLQRLFPNRQFRLMDTLLTRVRDGSEMAARSVLPEKLQEGLLLYQELSVDRVQVVDGQDTTRIHLKNLQYRVAPDPGFKNALLSLATALDLRPGQKVVVGKGTLEPGTSPFVLVITATVEPPSGK